MVSLDEKGEWRSRPDTLHRTRYCIDTDQPEWDEPLRLTAVQKEDYLFLKCFDRDLFRQEELGELLLCLGKFLAVLAPRSGQ